MAEENTAEQPEQDLQTQLEGAAATVPDQPESAGPETPSSSSTASSATPVTVPAWREVADELGFNIPDGVDEKLIFRRLMEGYSRGQQDNQRLQEITPHWSEFQKWQAQRQAEEQARQAEVKRPWWDKYKPVEYDQNWQTLVTKDMDGNLIPAPGAPPDIVQRLRTAELKRQELASRLTDPSKPFAWLEDEPVKEYLGQLFQEQYQRLREQERAAEFARNTIGSPDMAWLFSHDKDGNRVATPDGRPVLSEHGQVYQQSVNELYGFGIPPEVQHKYAQAMARAEYAINILKNQATQQNPTAETAKPKGTARQQRNEAFHAAHERAPNMAANIPGPAEGFSAPPTNTQNLDLRDLLTQALKDASDEDVRQYAVGLGRT